MDYIKLEHVPIDDNIIESMVIKAIKKHYDINYKDLESAKADFKVTTGNIYSLSDEPYGDILIQRKGV